MTDRIDIIIDASVIGHSSNTGSPYFESSVVLLRNLNSQKTLLALDDTGKAAPALLTSHMYMEYCNCVSPVSLAAQLLRAWASGGRLVFYRRPKVQLWKQCKSLIPKNKGDQIVLGVGVMSTERLIVTNDFNDFSNTVRSDVKAALRVVILASDSPELSGDG